MTAPIPSASVLVVRERSAHLEVLLAQRSDSAPIYRGFYVFPGGHLSQIDFDLARKEQDLPKRDSPPRVFFIGAVRELFEETGILYCRDAGGTPLDLSSSETRSLFSEYRRNIQTDPGVFSQMIRAEKLNLALDLLLPFSRWVTPSDIRTRHETHFFLAASPPKQQPEEDRREVSRLKWIDPLDALTQAQPSQWPLLAPTLANLRILADYTELKSLLRDYALSEAPSPRMKA